MGNTSFDKAAGSGRRWWLIGGGCLALFVCLCIIAIVAVLNASESTLAQLRQMAGLSGGASTSVEYVPTSAPMFGVVNPSFAQAANAKKVMDILSKNPAIKLRLDDLAKQGAGQNNDFNYDRDIAPWIGTEIGFALLDVPAPSTSSSSSTPPGFVLMVASRDTAKSDDALKRFRAAAEAKGTAYTEETYQGVTIVSAKSSSSTKSSSNSLGAYATYQSTVLLADSTDAVKKALDTKKAGGATNLASSAAYKSIVDKLPKDRAMTVVADVRALAKSAPNSATRAPGAETIDAISGVGLSLGFTDDGIRLDGVLTYDLTKLSDPAKKLFTVPANPNKTLDVLPESMFVAISGQNLKLYWDFYNATISQDAQAKKQFDQSLQGIKTQTGIDMDADVFAWMTGEYALSVVPAKPLTDAMGPSAPPVGLMVLIEAKDASLAKEKMTKISGALTKQGLTFSSKKVNGTDMQVVAGMEAQGITAGYGFLDNFVVIGSAEDVLAAAVDGKKAPLNKSSEFTLGFKVLPQPNTGVGFLSIPRILDVVKGSLTGTQLADYQASVEPALRNFKAISVACS